MNLTQGVLFSGCSICNIDHGVGGGWRDVMCLIMLDQIIGDIEFQGNRAVWVNAQGIIRIAVDKNQFVVNIVQSNCYITAIRCHLLTFCLTPPMTPLYHVTGVIQIVFMG
jgi:hypothetical protein